MSSDSTRAAALLSTVAELAQACKLVRAEELVAKHGSAFLLERSEAQTDARPTWARFATVAITKAEIGGARPTRGSDRVFGLVAQSHTPLYPWIGVGRADKNQIVLKDPSVSKLHAILRCVDDRYEVADAGSRNGTKVNGCSAPRYDRGGAVALRPGDRVQLGLVELLFLGPRELLSILEDWRAPSV